MSAIDPASRLRPDWWTDDTFLHLCALEDQALPCKGLSDEECAHPTLPVLKRLLAAVWWLGKTGGMEREGTRNEFLEEALRTVEANATAAAEAARLTLSRRVDRGYDDEDAESERECEATDPNWGPPQAHFLEGHFTVRLPGYSGDTVSATIRVDEMGHLTVSGSGPLADLSILGRLEARAAIQTLENLVELQLSQPLAAEDGV